MYLQFNIRMVIAKCEIRYIRLESRNVGEILPFVTVCQWLKKDIVIEPSKSSSTKCFGLLNDDVLFLKNWCKLLASISQMIVSYHDHYILGESK